MSIVHYFGTVANVTRHQCQEPLINILGRHGFDEVHPDVTFYLLFLDVGFYVLFIFVLYQFGENIGIPKVSKRQTFTPHFHLLSNSSTFVIQCERHDWSWLQIQRRSFVAQRRTPTKMTITASIFSFFSWSIQL